MQTSRSALQNQQSVKLSVTVKRRLEAKYNEAALEKINAAIERWKNKDLERGIQTLHVAVDDPKDVTMKKLKVKPVSSDAAAPDVKQAIDDLSTQLNPDYVVLFGADDIVPMFEVNNPTRGFKGEDHDKNVPTDNPYASSEPFSMDHQHSYLIPDRVIGRIPDMVSGDTGRNGDPAWFVDYLETATNWESKPDSFYKDPYVICTWEAKDAAKECVKKAFSTSSLPLLICPPDSDSASDARDRLSSRLHMIKCHGNNTGDATFWGYRPSAANQNGIWKPALTSATLKTRVEPNTVVAAMCCYGAQIFSPKDADNWPLPSTYLRKGALSFVGSTMKAWVGTYGGISGADVIVTYYLKRVLEGDSIGLAFLKSKQDYYTHDSNRGKILGPEDDKTLIEYILLGDPSIHPVGSVGDSANLLAIQERRQRRVARAVIAAGVRSLLPTRSDVTDAEKDKATAVFASDIAKDAIKKTKGFSINPAEVQVQKVNVRFPVSGTTMRDPIRSRQSLEYRWLGQRDRAGEKQFCLLKVETDQNARPWRASVMYTS